MAVAIKVTSEESSVIEALQQIINLDTSKMYDEIGAYGVASTQMRFVDQHDPDGNPWKQSWRAIMQNGQTLRDTGRLMNSLTHNVFPNGVEWGTNVEYAESMHFGFKAAARSGYLLFNVAGQWRKVKSVKSEPRPFLGINSDDEKEILDIIGNHIHG